MMTRSTLKSNPAEPPGTLATPGCVANLLRLPVARVHDLIKTGAVRVDRIKGNTHVCLEDVEGRVALAASGGTSQ